MPAEGSAVRMDLLGLRVASGIQPARRIAQKVFGELLEGAD
jgi:hypothetical protein